MNTVPARLSDGEWHELKILCGHRDSSGWPCDGMIATVNFGRESTLATGYKLIPRIGIQFPSKRPLGADGVYRFSKSVQGELDHFRPERDRRRRLRSARSAQTNEAQVVETQDGNSVCSFPVVCECPKCKSCVLVSAEFIASIPYPDALNQNRDENGLPTTPDPPYTGQFEYERRMNRLKREYPELELIDGPPRDLEHFD